RLPRAGNGQRRAPGRRERPLGSAGAVLGGVAVRDPAPAAPPGGGSARARERRARCAGRDPEAAAHAVRQPLRLLVSLHDGLAGPADGRRGASGLAAARGLLPAAAAVGHHPEIPRGLRAGGRAAARPHAGGGGGRGGVAGALDCSEGAEIGLDALRHGPPPWAEYVRGVASTLTAEGHPLRGWEGVLRGEVPIGAGLSSSAALELAAARAFTAVSGLAWDPPRMARAAQRAENEWVGMRCGVMDQTISACGREGHALLIDCRSLEARPVPIPPGVAVVV